MAKTVTILLLEDEPLILMDLEFAAEDRGLTPVSATSPEAALEVLSSGDCHIDCAVLDVTLGKNKTCFPVARELQKMGIPYILHSGDLDRHNERIRDLDAMLVAKPAPSDLVIETAVGKICGGEDRLAAE